MIELRKSPDIFLISNTTRTIEDGAEAFGFLLQEGSATISIGGKAPAPLPLGISFNASFIGTIYRFDTIVINATAGTVLAAVLK